MFPPTPTMDEKHRYSFGGASLPGVTEVLKAAGIIQYSMPAAIGAAVMERGTFVHRLCELDDAGTLDEATVDPALRGYLDAWRGFKEKLTEEGGRIVPEWTERRMVCAALGYAGTMDRAIAFGEGDAETLDIKSGAMKRWTGVQLAAYDFCRGLSKKRRHGVEVKKDGKFRWVRFEEPDDYAVWLAALKVYKFAKENI